MVGRNNFLPSPAFQKRAGIILSVLLVVGVTAWVVSRDDNQSADTAAQQQLAFSKIDTDGDGLRDWEEGIWETDPNNPDSDNDGMNDGDEVAANRDPNKTGADTLTDSRIASVYTGYKQYSLQNVNITKQISDKILPHALALANQQSSGQAMNAENTDLFIKMITDEYDIQTKTYTIEDLQVVESNQTTLADYFINILEATNNVLENQAGNEVAIILDQIDEINIKKQQRNYRSFIADLRNMKVPSPLAVQHVTVLNNFSLLNEAYQLLITSQQDPAKSIIALEAVSDIQAKNQEVISELALSWQKQATSIYD